MHRIDQFRLKTNNRKFTLVYSDTYWLKMKKIY